MEIKKMAQGKSKRKWIIVASILVIIIGIRLALPYLILRYANKVLNEMEGYRGSIEDVDLSIYRGAYQVKGIVIKKLNANIPTPFLDINEIDLSIEWPALLQGKVVGSIRLNKPVVNFVGGSSKENNQTGVENDWTEPIKKLMPLKINKFEINQGSIFYYDFTSTPKVDLYLKELRLVATNLSNAAKTSSKLPSDLKLSATSIGKGELSINGKVNILKEIPDFDLDLKFTSVSLTSLNDFTKAYGKFDFEKGTMSLYSEVALADKKIDGYIKPILTDVKILDLKEKDEGLFKKIWEGVLEVTEEVLENRKEDQFATKTPIKGTLGEIKTKVIPTILNVLKNAFIEAFSKNVDSEISFEDAQKDDPKENKKSKKEERKEKRKEKREEKKKEKEEKK